MITLDRIREAVNYDNFDPDPAHARMAPLKRRMTPPDGVTPRQAGVLILLYPNHDDWHIVLTRRNQRLRGHSGQISFPGGQRDPQDRSFTDTALRETCEELGLCDSPITVIGTLTTIYIPPSNFQVHPTVATIDYKPDFLPNPEEVSEVFAVPIHDLLDENIQQAEYRVIQGSRVLIPYYMINGHKVWGATAVMLSEFEQRLRILNA